jgi:hypothetical protein
MRIRKPYLLSQLPRSARWTLAIVAVSAVVAVHVYNQSVPENLPRALQTVESLYFLGLAALLLLICAALGRRILIRLGIDSSLSDEEVVAFGITLGCLALGYAVWMICLAGLFLWPVLLALVVLLVVWLHQDLAWIGRGLVPTWSAFRHIRPEIAATYVVIGLLLAQALLRALAPPTDFDAQMYHIAAPAAYLARGGYIAWLPNVPQTAFPFTSEMLFGLLIALGDDTAPALFSFGIVLATCVTLAAFARRFFCRPLAATLAIAIFLSTTYFIELMGRASQDPLWVLAELQGLYAVCAWIRCRDRKWLIVAGMTLGTSLASKYLGVVGLLLSGIGLAAVGLRAPRSQLRGSIGAAVWVTTIALLIASPWYAKNWLQFGNPVFPYFFGGNTVSLGVDPSLVQLTYGVGRDWQDFLQLPLNMYIRANAFSEDPASFPTVLAWLLPLYAIVKRRPLIDWLLAWGLARFVLWSLMAQNLRYLAPVSPVIALALAYILAEIAATSRPTLALAARSVPLAGLLICFAFIQIRDRSSNLLYVLGLEARSGYLERELKGEATFDYINAELPFDAVVLCISVGNGYYIRRTHYADGVNANWDSVSNGGRNGPLAVRDRLAELGITHLLVSEVMIMSPPPEWSGDLHAAANVEKMRTTFHQFKVSYLLPLYDDGPLSVYKIDYAR